MPDAVYDLGPWLERRGKAMSPPVSIILPTLNERGFVFDCLKSLVGQDYDNIVEILVADGGSVDGTPGIVSGFGEPVRLLRNPGVSAAAAMNVGLAEAKGEVIVRTDAHTTYSTDYVRQCVRVLAETAAANVGGPMVAIGTTRFGRAVAAVTSSPLGVGPGRFHYAREREVVDTVYLGCWSREALERIGGFDEVYIQWGAEDQELNFRLRKAGASIVVDPAIQSWYVVRDTPRRLARQYFNYGICKASTLVKHGSLPSWRPLVPTALVLVASVSVVASRGWRRGAIPLLHAASCALIAARVAPPTDTRITDVFAAVEICHWSYGLGMFTGLGRAATGRNWVCRPQHRR